MNEFHYSARVYYEDTDSGGVVYHANYLKFMDRARAEWLRSLGFELDVLARDPGILFAVRAVHIDYRRPARFNDLLTVSSRIEAVRRTSMMFVQDITRMQEPDQVLCSGQVRVVCIGTDSFRPQPIPQTVLTEIVGDH